MNAKKNEVAVAGKLHENYLMLGEDGDDALALLKENLGGGGLNLGDLIRVKMPSGGGNMWMFEGVDGPEAHATLTGIIAAKRTTRKYWKDSLDDAGSGEQPDCKSQDGLVGIGNPGGECKDCQWNQFDTAAKGGGKACREHLELMLVREGDFLPVIVDLSPTSLGAARKYLTRLMGVMKPFYTVVTEIGLEKVQSKSGQDYARATFKKVEYLERDQVDKIKAFRATIGID